MRFISVFVLLALSQTVFSEMGTEKRIKIQKRSYFRRAGSTNEGGLHKERSAFLAKKRGNLINELRQALRTSKDVSQSNELKLRLASLFIEEFKYQNDLGQNAENYLRKALGILEELVQKKASCQRPDEVLFLLAQTHQELRNDKRAAEFFTELTVNHKASPFLEEAYLQMADRAFDQGDFEKSLTQYEFLRANPQSPLFLYAHYKTGWAYFNLNRLELSIKHFRTVVEQDSAESQSLALKNEATRDLCYPLSELKKYEEGYSFFSTQEETTFRRGLECLAASAQAQGETDTALKLYRDLIAMDSIHKGNPSYSLASLETQRKTGKWDQLIASLEESLATYQGNSTWREIHSSDPVFFKQISTQFETITREWALECHSIAQKTKNVPLYQQAKTFYELYNKYFPHTVETAKLQFYLAEIYYKLKDFKLAALAYENVFNQAQASPQLRQEALEYAVLATSTETDPGNEENFLRLADLFTEKFQKHPRTPEILFKATKLRHDRKDDKAAYLGFWKIINQYPQHALVPKASMLVLDILNKRNDYANLIVASKKLRVLPVLKSTPLAAEISSVLRTAELKQISLMEESEQFDKAGKAYLQYVEVYGREDLNLQEKAMYNAGVCFGKANKLNDALKVQERFLKLHPSSPYRKELLLQVAKAYESLAELGLAASFFSRFQSENPQHPDSPAALRLAGLYFWADSNPQLAESTLLKAIQLYPALRETVEQDLVELYKSENWWGKVFDYLVSARQRKGISFTSYLEHTLELAGIQEQQFNKPATSLWAEAAQVVEKYRGLIQGSPKGPDLIGRVLLKKVAPRQALFESIRLQLPQSLLERKLEQKLKLLKELEKAYSEIATLGGEPALAATYSIAQAYKTFSQDVESAPVPTDLSAEQLDIYRDELSKQMIQPMSKKALAFSVQCLEKEQELSLFSTWGPKCKELHSSMETTNEGNTHTVTLSPFYLSWIFPASSDQNTARNFIHSSPLFKDALKELFFQTRNESIKAVSLQTLSEQRLEEISRLVATDEPKTTNDYLTYFNALRLSNPIKASHEIKAHMRQREPDEKFHRLLAFTYLDQGEYTKAKITWLSLIARGIKDGSVYNNLAVTEALRGNVNSALSLFAKASELGSVEAKINQGFIALAMGKSSEAVQLFEQSLESSQDELAKLGHSLAKLNNHDEQDSQKGLEEIQKRFPNLSWLVQSCFNCLAEKKSDR